MEAGQRIRFSYGGRELEGLVIQVKDGQGVVKLDSGYNMLIPEDTDTVILPEKKGAREKPAPVKQDQLLPPVTILHTGGTIASKVDYRTGAVVAQFDPQELLDLFPELLTIANVSSRLLRNMSSDDMRFGHYNLMARAVLEEINKGATGVIITHGTDTMHYSAAALSFALEDLSVPVVLVGSQRSSDRGSADSSTNLVGALRFITETKLPGVFVAMHENSSDGSIAIMEGTRARKSHSSRRDAFVSVNAPLFARVTDKIEILNAARAAHLRGKAHGKTRVMPFNEDLKVGLWKAHPQSWVEELKPYDHFDGLVIEGTGLGHAPITGIDEFTNEQHPFIREKIAKLAREMPVAMATQTVFGRVNMNVYSPGRALIEMGVLGTDCDMHPETAFVKLAWLLSNFPKEEVRQLYAQDFRGELSERSPLEDAHRQE